MTIENGVLTVTYKDREYILPKEDFTPAEEFILKNDGLKGLIKFIERELGAIESRKQVEKRNLNKRPWRLD